METSQSRQMLTPVPLSQVELKDQFWAPRQEMNRTVTIPAVLSKLEESGHIDALRLEWKPGMPKQPHIFWESDLAKWMEAASYSLMLHPDPQLEARLDEIIDLLESAQQPDGYLNVHFTVVEPEKRWTNVRDWHELYNAGHLIEGAVAYHQATGKSKFLDIMRRYADYIDATFGPEPDKKHGYPGHEELELALVKLYRHTSEERYLKLSQYFVDERGKQPHYYDEEAQARGDDPAKFWARTYEYNQSHKPVREQDEAVGHSVRGVYLYSAMADLALETGDHTLIDALHRLWDNVTQRRMYITGGIGSTRFNEGFTWDYDLPNDTAYAETCAAIGLFIWAHRMQKLELDSRYADVMERALYNGIISSVNQQGNCFFYVNPLEVKRVGEDAKRRLHLFTGHRKEWYDCACCPPNIARLIASLGGYLYAQGQNEFIIHQFVGGTVTMETAGQQVSLHTETQYPWDGDVRITVVPQQAAEFTIRLRLPGWCQQANLSVNGESLPVEVENGYIAIHRAWQPGDQILYHLEMPVMRVYADPQVHMNTNRVALQRGPLVYCLESIDNGPRLNNICLPRNANLSALYEETLMGGLVTLQGEAQKIREVEGEGLYRSTPGELEQTAIKAVPYYAWDNRETGDMLVWLNECS